MKGDGVNKARVVRDRPYWAVIDQQFVWARFLSRREARRYCGTLNAGKDSPPPGQVWR